eukprot:jgi/Bigna1/136618/aug1.35_g11326
MPRFQFHARKDPINWEALETLNLAAIVQSGDVNALSCQIDNAAFSCVTKEDLKQVNPGRVLGLIRYLQILVEYLLKVQNHLAEVGEANRRTSIQHCRDITDLILYPFRTAIQHSRDVKDLKATLSLRDQQLSNARESSRLKAKAAFEEGRVQGLEEKKERKNRHSNNELTTTQSSSKKEKPADSSSGKDFIKDQFFVQRGVLKEDIDRMVTSSLTKAMHMANVKNLL